MSVRPPAILFCHCRHAQAVPAAVKEAVLQHLRDAGQPFAEVPDLCELCARADPALERWAASGRLRIVACYPRAVRWLLAAGGVGPPAETCEVLNMRTLSAAEVIAGLGSGTPPAESLTPGHEPAPVAALRETAAGAPSWIPWFPVIDRDRCTNCMQCLSFCLFGVYGLDEKRIRVQNPEQCKTLCPACARVCPEAAILFPKYKAGPINGDAVNEADLQREKMKVDISALLGGDVYAVLRTRSERARSRFGKERDADQALKERQKCLQALGELAADVPPEVLRTLPSPEEIARRVAETAAARKTTPS